MNKIEFLSELKTERARWDALLREVGEERMTQPGVEGEWSVKDIIAHNTWGEAEMLGVLKARALQGSPLWDLPLHERNAIVREQNRDRPLADVLEEASRVYAELLGQIEALTDEDLNDPRRFAEMPEEWQPWKLLANNTYEHYQDHGASIRAWLDAQGGDRGSGARDEKL